MAKAKIISQSTDPKNGIVTLSQNGKQYTLTNNRKDLTIHFATLEEAQAEYDFQISDSQTDGQLKSLEAGPEAPPADQDPAAPVTPEDPKDPAAPVTPEDPKDPAAPVTPEDPKDPAAPTEPEPTTV